MELRMSFQIKEHLRNYVEAVEGEISLFGKIEVKEDCIELVDMKLFKQECSAASSTIDSEDVAKFMTEQVKQNKSMVGWNAWIHSHADMDVFWSGTDTGTMDENPLKTNFMLSLVTNKAEEYRARIDVYEPIHLFKDNLDVVIEYPLDNSFAKQIKKEVKEKIIKPKPVKHNAKNWMKQRETEELYDYNFNENWERDKEVERLVKENTAQQLEDMLNIAYVDKKTSWDEIEIIEEAINFLDETYVK